MQLHSIFKVWKCTIYVELERYTDGNSEIKSKYYIFLYIRELSIYRTQDNFKALVDYIYSLGFVICMMQGDYYVEHECNNFFD